MASGQLEGDGFVAASKEYSELEPVAKAAAEVRRLRTEIETLEHMAQDSSDPDLHEMAVEELEDVTRQLSDAEMSLAISLLPRDSADDRPAMLEIRAGTGGDEAALFAGDLYRMYERYAAGQGWKIEPISVSSSDVGGFKEVVVAIKGIGVFAKLKYESGVHRVQRVPVQDAARQSSAIQTKCLPKSMPIAKSVLRRSSCPAIRTSTNATCSRVMFCQSWNMAGWKFNPLTLPYVRPDPRQSMRRPARLVRGPLTSPAAYAASG